MGFAGAHRKGRVEPDTLSEFIFEKIKIGKTNRKINDGR